MDPRAGYITPFAIASFGILVIAIITWRRRQVRGGKILFFLCVAAGEWSLTEGMLLLGFDYHTNLFIAKIQYLGIAAVPPLVLAMVVIVFGLSSYITRTRIRILIIAAIAVNLVVLTNGLHHLHYADTYVIDSGPVPLLGTVHGPWWYAVVTYHYLLILIATVILVRQLRRPSRLYRGQAFVLLASVIIVWVVNGIYVFGFSPIPSVDIGPIGFALVAASFAWGFFRFNLLDVAPVAKEEIYDNLLDPVVVLDKNLRVVDVNRPAEYLFDVNAMETTGTNLQTAFKAFPEMLSAMSRIGTTEVSIASNGNNHIYDMKTSELRDREDRDIGWLVILHEITKRKELEEELQRIASTDALTGAWNRRFLFEQAGREFLRAKRYNRPLCAVMLDIDRFKRLNDKRGHDVGDEALKLLVKACQSSIRGGDLFGRIGGEEFVVVLTDQGIDAAMRAAERIRSDIESIEVPDGQEPVKFTASLGVASMGEDDASFEDILKRADTGLYAAKDAGRNCVRSVEFVR